MKMGDKLNREYFEAGTAAFNYNNVTGGTDSASGGSGGSGMDCLPLRTPPEPFHYLISEQAKSLVALQELQNEVGALLEFRDLVIETFPNLRSKMPPSTPASSARRDWEPGVRVRRKLAAGTDSARAKPQPSVQDSGFSTETSCGKDAHSSASASASASRSRPMEDELWALLDVIQRKGGRLRDEAEQLRSEIDSNTTAEESFARAMQACDCGDLQRLRNERDALLARAASLEAAGRAAGGPRVLRSPRSPRSPRRALGSLDAALATPRALVAAPDRDKFAAILLESNPVELQRQLLSSTVHNQVLCDRLRRAAEHRTLLLERLERERELTDDLKFRLEEKSIELEGALARTRQLESERSRTSHSSMSRMEPLPLPDEDAITDTPRRRPSRIPLHTAHKGQAPRPPPRAPSRPSSAASRRSAVPVRRDAPDTKSSDDADSTDVVRAESEECLSSAPALVREYVTRLAPLLPRLSCVVRMRPLPAALPPYAERDSLAREMSRSIRREEPLPLPPYAERDSLAREMCLSIRREEPLPLSPYTERDSLARELSRSIRREEALGSLASPDSLWNGRPQQYFESMNYGKSDDYDNDSLAG